MTTVTEYFEEKAYKPKWFLGDRVEGKWKGIPFIGTVGNDSLISDQQGPIVTVFLDLPIKYKGNVYNIITLKVKDLKKRT